MSRSDSPLRNGTLVAVVVMLALTVPATGAAALGQQTGADVDEIIDAYRQRLAEIEARLAGEQAREVARHGVQEDRARRERMAPRVHVGVGGPTALFRGDAAAADWLIAHADELELTEEQQRRIRDAERDYRRAEIERDAAVEVAELDLEDLLRDEYSADLDAVQQKMEEISRLRVEDRIARLRLGRQIHAVLTPEQQEQVEEMRPSRWHAGRLLGGRLHPFGWDGPRPFPERFELRLPRLHEQMERWFDDDGHFWFFRDDGDEDSGEEASEEGQEGDVDGAAGAGRARAAGEGGVITL